MVVPMNPCRRRGGLWWRMEVGSGGEENWGKGEKKGRWRRKAGKGEKKGKESGFLSSIAGVESTGHWIKSIAGVGSAGQWIKSITVVGIAGHCNFFKINNRRWDCRPLNICLIAGVVNAGLCHLFPNALVWLYF